MSFMFCKVNFLRGVDFEEDAFGSAGGVDLGVDCRAVAGDEAEFEHGFDMLLAADFEDFEADLREARLRLCKVKEVFEDNFLIFWGVGRGDGIRA